jgi:DNA-binding IclR family transcriptional regulator
MHRKVQWSYAVEVLQQSGRPIAQRRGLRERSVDRVLQIFEFLQWHRQPVRVGELARRMNAPRSSIYSLVKVLTDAGLLETVGEGRVFFGKAMYLYGASYMRENALVRRGREEVDRLAGATGETSELCMLQNGRYTIIHMCPGSRPFRISSAVGLQIPLPWTASGRLLLAGLSRREVETMIAPDDMTLPDGRQISMSDFLASIKEAGQQGYCVTTGLVEAFTQCIAAPVFGADGSVEATICFVVPSDTAPERTRALTEVLLDSGRRLSLSASTFQGG